MAITSHLSVLLLCSILCQVTKTNKFGGFRKIYWAVLWKKRPQNENKAEISRVPDLGQGKNELVLIWRENLALLSEEFTFWSFPDPARSELFRNLTN